MTKSNHNLHLLTQTISTLRGINGCPWDKKQTPASLIKHLESETAELVAAINNDDIDNTCEELGDVLYILLMISRYHSEHGKFDLADVISTVNEKLIRRHPHVFEGKPYKNQEDLDRQWRAIKAQEKQK